MDIITKPAFIDIGEANYPGPHDGSEVIIIDWGDGWPDLVKKDAAVDTACGILHLASEPIPREPLFDWKGVAGAFLLVTCLTMYAWALWTGLTLIL